jgi:hypothetical protein
MLQQRRERRAPRVSCVNPDELTAAVHRCIGRKTRPPPLAAAALG